MTPTRALFVLMAAWFLSAPSSLPAKAAGDIVKTGAEVLAQKNFASLRGKRIGLIVNHTARIGTTHLIDAILATPGLHLSAIFGPEHGLKGLADAGASVHDGRYRGTDIPVYSLYGKTRKPTRAMLDGVDILVFDMQDIGARFYTYISTMGLAMQAAAEAGIAFMVLDRPNPLGGDYVSGFGLHPPKRSFIGQYQIPIAHGLSVGELARMIKGEGLLTGLDALQLSVVPMEGWQRAMRWPETGRDWVVTSPAIPGFLSALAYPGTAFFEASTIHYGRGTDHPFQLIGAPWLNADALARRLNGARLPGVRFRAVRYTPRRMPGITRPPKYLGRQIPGIFIDITDYRRYRAVETGIHMLHAVFHQARPKGIKLIDRPRWLALMAGNDRLFTLLRRGTPAQAIIADWRREVEDFARRRAPYLLY